MHLLLKIPSVQTLCYKEQHLLDVRLFTKMKNFIILGVNLLKKIMYKRKYFPFRRFVINCVCVFGYVLAHACTTCVQGLLEVRRECQVSWS